ncbi:hypothetical protein LTR93_010841 [Exophiala xenobiotica]|nr:hypothetical protein LTR93_010841 [Exophiala xenobiotica]
MRSSPSRIRPTTSRAPVNLVGPGGNSGTTLISCGGTFTYSVTPPMSLSDQGTGPGGSCGEIAVVTGETSNATYGAITPKFGSTVTQSLSFTWQGTPAVPESALTAYWGSDSSQHIIYTDFDGHVHELYIHSGPTGGVDNDLTAMSGGTPAAPPPVYLRSGHSGPLFGRASLSAYWGSDNSQHVNFVDAQGDIHELYIHPGAPPGVVDSYWGSDNSQHVNFIDSSAHVHELYIHPGAAGWVDYDLTVVSKGGSPAQFRSGLDSYWGSDNSQHVNYISVDGHVRELYIKPRAAGWVEYDLSGET